MILNLAEIIVAVALIVVIMLQMQGSGLSSSFGGGGEFYRSKQSIDKLLIFSTIVLAFLFGILSIILLIPH
ncbi:MAG: preprotein translocase subunit SecG [Candidatus Levybacteria bacterium]|nr:preprotein translocase subunit SecG [Candidatus Levybacteria bacterium]